MHFFQVSYAIGLAEPLSITVFDYGTSELSSDQLLSVVKKNFDLRPGRIVKYAFFSLGHYSRGHFPLLFFLHVPAGI
jgi:S-adenosylmethionine synthetase